MRVNGADILIRSLIDHGVDTVFGYPGGQVLDIYDAIYAHRRRLRHITSAHEQGACHAADGYARVSGKTGVVIATSGPGATNLVTGIATAFLDSVPLIAITGNVDTKMMGKDSFQEVDIAGITMPITKYNYIVKDVRDLEYIIDEAFTIANSGRKGPVLIDIPKDIQRAKCEYIPHKREIKIDNVKTDYSDLDKVIELINTKDRPCFYIGGGVLASDASQKVLALARKIGATIISSMMGLSAIDSDEDIFLGMAGMHGTYAANYALHRSDLLIAIGSRFSDRATGDKSDYYYDKDIVHIDIDPAEIDKNINVNHYLIGDVSEVVRLIDERVGNVTHDDWQSEIRDVKASPINQNHMTSPFNPERIISAVNGRMDERDIVATDVGQHQMWVTEYFKFHSPRTLLTSGGLGTMGYGLGASIGGAIATGRRVVLFTSDGSFHMNMNELATVASYNLPVLVVVLNNKALGMVKQWQKLFYKGRLSETELDRHTDYGLLARAMGVKGYNVDNMESLDKALDEVFSGNEPALISCDIDSDELVLPMIPPSGNNTMMLTR